MDEEIQWMLDAKSGDSASFEKIIDRYQKPFYNFFYRFLGNASSAEDATQTLFLQIYSALPRYKPTANLRTYLYRSAKNLAINLSRRNTFLSFFSLDDSENPINISDSPDKRPEKILENMETVQQVQEALQSLPSRQRIAIIYQYFEDCSVTEIGDRMEISTPAVESLLFRARTTLKEKLSQI